MRLCTVHQRNLNLNLLISHWCLLNHCSSDIACRRPPPSSLWPQNSYVVTLRTLFTVGLLFTDLRQDPNDIKIIYLRATGGEVGASSALAPKIGPLGLVRMLLVG